MKLEREVIIDLLPAYFSSEASAATRALVEDYFREHPDFERSARDAGGWLDRLNVSASAPDPEKEKLALERARLIVEERGGFLWLAVCFTAILLLFRIQNHKLVWIMWDDPKMGLMMSAVAVVLWVLYWRSRVRRAQMRARVRFLVLAIFYTFLFLLLSFTDRKFHWFAPTPVGGGENLRFLMIAIAVALWITFLYHWWKSSKEKE
jgi:hypothetical protein